MFVLIMNVLMKANGLVAELHSAVETLKAFIKLLNGKSRIGL